MMAPRKIGRWLTAVTMLQGTLLFLIVVCLMFRLNSVATEIRDSLLRSNVAVEQVDKVNEEFSSILSVLMWVLLGGLFLTGVTFSLLRSAINRNWPKPMTNEGGGSNTAVEHVTTSKADM